MALRRLHRRHGRPEAVDAARPVTGDGDAASCVGVWAACCALEKGSQRREARISLQGQRTYVGKTGRDTGERHTLSSLTHMAHGER